MSKIEAVILDWAGTTVDFGSMAPVNAFIKAFEAFGIIPTVEEVRKPMGMLKWDHVHTMLKMPRIAEQWEKTHGKIWTKEDVDKIYQLCESSIMAILKDFAEPKPYVVETVNALKKKGIKIGSTTGYTDAMMDVVAKEAALQGYSPDCWFSPNSVGDKGRPYPYMIFKNLETLGVSSVTAAIKVGDTISDIKEGKNAGLISVGIIEGSSLMGLSYEEYENLSKTENENLSKEVEKKYMENGADYVIKNMSHLEDLIEEINQNA